MVNERSAGAVLFYSGSATLEYLLLHYPAGHWDFPKGNIELGEKTSETVEREISEETGIHNIRIIPGFELRITYNYRRNGNLITKEVIFLLAESTTKVTTVSYEHEGFSWLPFEDAVKKVTFENARKLLTAANNFLKNRASPTSKSLDEFAQRP